MRIIKKLIVVVRPLDRRGAALVEYALLAALVAVVAFSTLGAVGNGVKNNFNAVTTKL